jgi:U4/U6.U5 tri-snRNP-associated protein 1
VTLENLVQVKREPRARSTSAVPSGAEPSRSGDTQERKPVVVKIEGIDMETLATDVKMEDGEEEDDEDELLAEMALREGLSLEEMRIKMDTASQVKLEEEGDDVSHLGLVTPALSLTRPTPI